MKAKEDRFLLPLTPALAVISAIFIDKFKKYKDVLLGIIVVFLLSSLIIWFYYDFKSSYNEKDLCFLQANYYLSSLSDDILVITDESSPVYYYARKQNHFYPNPFSLDSLDDLIQSSYAKKQVYIFFTEYDMPLTDVKNEEVKGILDSNFQQVYNCGNSSLIYRYDKI